MDNPELWSELIDLAHAGRGALLLSHVIRNLAEVAVLEPTERTTEPYARSILHHADRGEVMLAAWRRGGLSSPHDHGLARGFVVILKGRFLETTYEFDGGELLARAEREHSAGDLLQAAPGVIHDLYAIDEGLSLHVYVPRIHGMCVYDTVSRATLRVADDSGAWVPRAPAAIVERRPWLARGIRAAG